MTTCVVEEESGEGCRWWEVAAVAAAAVAGPRGTCRRAMLRLAKQVHLRVSLPALDPYIAADSS